MSKKRAKGYVCTCCSAEHKYPLYVFAQWTAQINHTCDCGAVHTICKGKASLSQKPKTAEVIPNAKQNKPL